MEQRQEDLVEVVRAQRLLQRAEAPAPQAPRAPQTTQNARAQPSPTRQPSPRPSQSTAQAEPTAVPAHQGARADVSQADWGQLQEAVRGCTACSLCQTRKQTVFGVGTPPDDGKSGARVDVMIVGEAPGENEDLQGEPFVGAAGQLLDQMLRSMGLTRSEDPGLDPKQQVYIANTLKCRPPRNRNPERMELERCEPFLVRQIELVQPKLILAMGRFAVQALLRTDEAIGKLRGRVHRYQGVPLVVTYHPAYLLRNLSDKAKAWEDLCLAMDTVNLS